MRLNREVQDWKKKKTLCYLKEKRKTKTRRGDMSIDRSNERGAKTYVERMMKGYVANWTLCNSEHLSMDGKMRGREIVWIAEVTLLIEHYESKEFQK